MPSTPLKKVKNELVILPSPKMTQLGEDSFIRLTKKTRNEHGLTNQLSIEVQDNSFVSCPAHLSVKKAYSNDLLDLYKNTALINLHGNIAFVSETTFNNAVGDDEQPNIITEEIDVILGTDPEFALKSTGAPHAIEAKKVLDESTKLKRFGQDGPCAEVRPIPSGDVNQLVKNTEEAFIQGLSTPANMYEWIGGVLTLGEPDGRWFQLGGHIHIGHPLSSNELNFSEFTPIIMRVLDELISVPLAVLEGIDGYRRRTLMYHNQVYGNWGDFRTKPKDVIPPQRFEWRTASGVWTLSPFFYMAVLHIAKKVCNSFYRMLNSMSRNCDGHPDENAILRFNDYINRRICKVHLPSKEDYKRFLQGVGSNLIGVRPTVNLAKEALTSSVDLFGMDKAIIELFLALCESDINDINKSRNLKTTWIDKENEYLVGTNLLKTIKTDVPTQNKNYKIISYM